MCTVYDSVLCFPSHFFPLSKDTNPRKNYLHACLFLENIGLEDHRAYSEGLLIRSRRIPIPEGSLPPTPPPPPHPRGKND